MKSKTTNTCAPEMRERAVHMILDREEDRACRVGPIRKVLPA